MGAATYILGVWLQIVEVWSWGTRLITYPDLERQGPLVGIFVAWAHSPQSWEVGEGFLRLVYDPNYPSDRTRRLKAWADSLGIIFSTWSGPEGAALLVEAPWPHKLPAMQWLQATLTSLELGDEHWYQWARHRYLQREGGLHLSREITCQRRNWRGTFPSYPALRTYFYTYLRPESLWVGVWGRLSLREKAELRRLWAYWRTPEVDTFLHPSHAVHEPLPDTTIENLWAYPIYGSACVETPESWPERLAFVEAFLARWQKESPPLQFKGAFEQKDRYCFAVRLDGRSYRYLRSLSHLSAKDSVEARAWAAAYTYRRLCLRGIPARYPDVWLSALLRRDSVILPDTMPDTLWWRGWPVAIRGVWLLQELYALDTLEEGESANTSETPRLDTLQEAPPLHALWFPSDAHAKPPLESWAAFMHYHLRSHPHRKWTLITYYRRRRHQAAALRRLHQVRRILIQQYRVPPTALDVQVRPASPDIPERAIRILCEGS